MSDPNVILGYIAEPETRHGRDPSSYRRANDAVLAGLPVDDPHPPLCRSMFAVTGDDHRQGSFRGARVIHFAANLNHPTDGLASWLDKFEQLLRRLYWIDAEVLVNGGWSGPSLALKYLIDHESAHGLHDDPPKLPRGWELKTYELNSSAPVRFDVSDYIGARRAATQQYAEDDGRKSDAGSS